MCDCSVNISKYSSSHFVIKKTVLELSFCKIICKIFDKKSFIINYLPWRKIEWKDYHIFSYKIKDSKI